MPMYYFHLCDEEILVDPDGTDLANIGAAREHAIGVARELMFNSGGILQRNWSQWTMSVKDAKGDELFSFALAEIGNRNSGN